MWCYSQGFRIPGHLHITWWVAVTDGLTAFLPPATLIQGLLWIVAVAVGGRRSGFFCDNGSPVSRPSGGIRAMSTMGALGKLAMLWGAWLTWQNTPWCSHWTAKSSLTIQGQNWLSRTLMLVMVSVLHLVLFSGWDTGKFFVLMPLYQPSQFEGERATELQL